MKELIFWKRQFFPDKEFELAYANAKHINQIIKSRSVNKVNLSVNKPFHQRCINSHMIEVYKYLNGNSPDILNDIFKLTEKMYNLRNFHFFQTENPRSLKYGLDAIPYRASHLWQQMPIDIQEATSKIALTHFRPMFDLCRNQVLGFY